MKKKDETPENQNVDCRDCKNHVGKAVNFMVFCSVLNIYRSVGPRICRLFK